ncbi:CENP-B N-terminal DNA-binding domain [Popillia japonica]|uniref:CENP-B N-terminal DNA-binding domain n=1 Tax=Popillia japonica TaxID=7064 RepID=A0AAW1MZD0_POPJA
MSKNILKYDDKLMQQALVAVKQNHVSVKSAAKQFNVPMTTLYYKVTGKYPEKRQMGPKTNLREEEEKIIIEWIFKSSHRDFPITKSQLLDSRRKTGRQMVQVIYEKTSRSGSQDDTKLHLLKLPVNQKAKEPNKYYPGQIKKINHRKKTYLMLLMEQSGHNFRWPEKEHSLWYSLEQIICKIGKPKPINSRGSYHVSEMAIYLQ